MKAIEALERSAFFLRGELWTPGPARVWTWYLEWRARRGLARLRKLIAEITPEEIDEFQEEELALFEAILNLAVAKLAEGAKVLRDDPARSALASTFDAARLELGRALHAIERGYAPGHLPPPSERAKLAETVLGDH